MVDEAPIRRERVVVEHPPKTDLPQAEMGVKRSEQQWVEPLGNEVRYVPRFPKPYFLLRGRDTVVSVEVYDEDLGVLVLPTAGTLTIIDENAAEIQAATGATFPASVATATVAAANVPVTLDTSDLWTARWTLTLEGVAYTFDQTAYLVRREPMAPVTAVDLEELHQALPDFSTKTKTARQVLSDAIRTSWDDILRRLIREGRNPTFSPLL